MNGDFAKTFTEVNEILKYSDEEVRKNIPYKFRRLIVQNMDKEYKVSINLNASLSEQNIRKDTKNLLALIYRDYIVDKDERNNLIKQEIIREKQIEQLKRERYNPNEIFKNKKRTQPIETNQIIIIKADKSIIIALKKIFNKIKEILKIGDNK